MLGKPEKFDAIFGIGGLIALPGYAPVVSSAACEYGAEQTADHVVLECPIYWRPHGMHGLTALDDETIQWPAQHLSLDLLQPSSGLKQLAQKPQKNQN